MCECLLVMTNQSSEPFIIQLVSPRGRILFFQASFPFTNLNCYTITNNTFFPPLVFSQEFVPVQLGCCGFPICKCRHYSSPPRATFIKPLLLFTGCVPFYHISSPCFQVRQRAARSVGSKSRHGTMEVVVGGTPLIGPHLHQHLSFLVLLIRRYHGEAIPFRQA